MTAPIASPISWPRRRAMGGTRLLPVLAIVALAAAGPASVDTHAAAATAGNPVAIAAAPDDGGPRRWRVVDGAAITLRDAPRQDAAAIVILEPGALLTNHGCDRQDDGDVWCAVQPLHSRRAGHLPAAGLQPARGPDGRVVMGRDDSTERARLGTFDAAGSAPCAQIRGQPLSPCTIEVARGTGGDATVRATFSNGFKRLLFFKHGAFISADPTMSGVGTDTDWHIEQDIHIIRVEDQRYELPDALIFGSKTHKN